MAATQSLADREDSWLGELDSNQHWRSQSRLQSAKSLGFSVSKLQNWPYKSQSADEPGLQALEFLLLVRRREQVAIGVESDLNRGVPHQRLHALG